MTSCSGQSSDSKKNTDIFKEKMFKGDTLKELGNNIMVVYQDTKNNYWFGSWEDGLYRYDGKTILHFTTNEGLSQNKIVSIREDSSGNLFFNTDLGISKFNGKAFTTLNITGADWKLQSGDLWFKGAQNSGMVYRYDGNDLHCLKLPETEAGEKLLKQSSKLPFPYSPYDVYTIYKDCKGNLWFGTASLGVCRYNGKDFMWITEKDLEFDVKTAFGIRSILEDNHGKFWFSNTLHSYTIAENGNFSKQNGINKMIGFKKFDTEAIISMTKDKNVIWFATYNQGVWSYDGKQVKHYPIKSNDKQITLFSIYKDNQGVLWLGTHENGIFKFNGKSFEKFKPS
ncbi:MAG: hypothetical protein H6605_02065 [Flavobacteriales bacterium]|nr:hypothetical protein [Flavobacteriales bacterium]